MSDKQTARAQQAADGNRLLRVLALIAVVAGVLLLAAAAFVLSYAGIHLVALAAGVSPRLARIYPLIFDAMLVVAGAAVLGLRGAGFFSRIYAWLSLLVLLAAAAGADTLHATGTKLPHKPAAAAAAIIPWALVLVGFGLLLALLRAARLRRAAAAVAQKAAAVPQNQAGLGDLFSSRTGIAAPARPQGPARPEPPEDADADGLDPGDPAREPGDPARDGASVRGQNGADGEHRPSEDDHPTDPGLVAVGSHSGPAVSRSASVFSAAPVLLGDEISAPPDAGPETDAAGAAEPATADTSVSPETEPAATVPPGDEAGTDDGTGGEGAGPDDEAGPVTLAAPAGAPSFDRKRSSPVPPEE